MADSKTMVPHPHRDDWIEFLYWCEDAMGMSAREIIAIVEKPWNYGAEYAEYRAEVAV